MTRYFMHLRDGSCELTDEEGQDFADLATLKQSVLNSARDLICGDVKGGVIDLSFRIDAENDVGEVVYTLPFKNAVTSILNKLNTVSVANEP